MSPSPVPLERIENRIFILRGHRVMLSSDLAELYEVEPRALVQAVKRTIFREGRPNPRPILQRDFQRELHAMSVEAT